MQSRNSAVDLARGFIVFIMPATHATLYYSQLSVQEGGWGIFLRCLAEGAGAQVFMFLLGFSFFLGRKKPLKTILKRAISIFCLAYILNFIKFVIPIIMGIIPQELLNYYHISSGFFGVIDLLMVGDIFQFAAISYLLCGVICHFKASWIVPLCIGFGVIVISPLVWGHRLDNFLTDYLLKLFNGAPAAVFFPFFPWGVYPLLGLAFGQLYQDLSKDTYNRLCLIAGLLSVVVGLIGMQFEPAAFNQTFYRLGPGGTIFHCGLVLLWMRLCTWISGKLPFDGPLLKGLRWCSINITIVYIVQWIVVVYLLPVFGFMDLGLIKTLIATVVVSLMTLLMVQGAILYKKKKLLESELNKEGLQKTSG